MDKILSGAEPKPVYLYTREGEPELRDANKVWGLGTRDTEDRLRQLGDNRDARVLCIGPAGENLNRAAMLANDYNHFASHSGGAVLGSKKLKAIVVCGTARPSIHNKAALVDAGWRWRKTLEQHDVKKKKTKYGHGEAWGALNNLNWRSTDLSPAHIHGFDQNDVVLRPCFQCARMCPWDAKLGEGEFKGTIVHFNAGGEWLDTFFNLGIKGNSALYLAERINDVGMKPQGGGSTKPPPDLRYRENWGPLSADNPDGWAWSHVLSEQYRQFTGIFGGCWFAQMNQKLDGLNSIVDSFNAITGWNFTMDQALESGYRSMILQSIFGTQRGWIADFDWKDVGPRFLEPIPDGKYKGFTIAKWLPDLVYEYYRLSGRHELTGRPFRSTLEQLDLLDLSEWAEH